MSELYPRTLYKIEEIAAALFGQFPDARELYLFGSRRHRTRSERSDIDLLLTSEQYVRHMEVREFIDNFGPALDIFLVQEKRAVSVINESYIESDDISSLVSVLSAIKIWDSHSGKVEADIDWNMTVRSDVKFIKTVLPNTMISLGSEFINSILVKNTRDYLEKLVATINKSYAAEIPDACAVFCRRLIELLIIEVFEAKKLQAKIMNAGNYLFLEGLMNALATERSIGVSRNTMSALTPIKSLGDKAAHGRNLVRLDEVDSLRDSINNTLQDLIAVSGIQRVSS